MILIPGCVKSCCALSLCEHTAAGICRAPGVVRKGVAQRCITLGPAGSRSRTWAVHNCIQSRPRQRVNFLLTPTLQAHAHRRHSGSSGFVHVPCAQRMLGVLCCFSSTIFFASVT